MKSSDFKKKVFELGSVLNEFDIEKLSEYMKKTDFIKKTFCENFLKSDDEHKMFMMCFMIIDIKAPENVYPNTKKKAKEYLKSKAMKEGMAAAKAKVDKKFSDKGE